MFGLLDCVSYVDSDSVITVLLLFLLGFCAIAFTVTVIGLKVKGLLWDLKSP